VAKTQLPVRFASVLIINCKFLTIHTNTSVKCYKGRNKAIKILHTEIQTNSYKIAIFSIGIPYSLLQKPKIPTAGPTSGNQSSHKCNSQNP